jgi:hypothetical protein
MVEIIYCHWSLPMHRIGIPDPIEPNPNGNNRP